MAALKIIAISDYVSYIKTNAKEVDALYQDILIGVTYFFRDKEAFSELKQTLEIMIRNNKDSVDVELIYLRDNQDRIGLDASCEYEVFVDTSHAKIVTRVIER